mmetsp:Transcript_22006/g.62884  ORF Transcript_22006/g.62884 Transcript_22006/m.62884 type:complete len:210 (+) Transcript_22006:461-1090(+)
MIAGDAIRSGYADKREVHTVYANFRRGSPSSTLCVKGPKLTSRISSGLDFESSLMRSKMRSVSPRKISVQDGERQATFNECNAAFRTANSSSPRHLSKWSLSGKIVDAGQCRAAAKRTAETEVARTRQLSLLTSKGANDCRTASWSTIRRFPKLSETTLRTLSSPESAYWLKMGKTRGTCGRRWSANERSPLFVTPMEITSRNDVNNKY